MLKSHNVFPFSSAMKHSVARAMLIRDQALTARLEEAFDRSPGKCSSHTRFEHMKAEHDLKVLRAIKSYRYGGGCVLDHITVLPQLDDPQSRPDANLLLKAMLKFKDIPVDAALINPESGTLKTHCSLDGRYKVQVLTFLCNYFRMPDNAFAIKPLPESLWTLPDLPNDQAASRLYSHKVPR